MENRTYYYARVSTKEQNLDRQLNAFRQLGATDRDIVTDKESGKNLDRSGYQALKTTILRQGIRSSSSPSTDLAAIRVTSEQSCNTSRSMASVSKSSTYPQQ